MKKLVLLLVAIATVGVAQAQFEAKVNPLGAIFGRPDLSAEYIVNDNFGVELTAGIIFGTVPGASLEGSEKPKQSGFGVKIAGKYYFSPDDGGDGWYGGLYLRQESEKIDYASDSLLGDYNSSVFAAGVEVGRKWVFDSGFLVESAIGVGRPLSEKREFSSSDDDYNVAFDIGIDLTYKLAIGYRFN